MSLERTGVMHRCPVRKHNRQIVKKGVVEITTGITATMQHTAHLIILRWCTFSCISARIGSHCCILFLQCEFGMLKCKLMSYATCTRPASVRKLLLMLLGCGVADCDFGRRLSVSAGIGLACIIETTRGHPAHVSSHRGPGVRGDLAGRTPFF